MMRSSNLFQRFFQIAAVCVVLAQASVTLAQSVVCGELALNIMIRAGARSPDAAIAANHAFGKLSQAEITDDILTGADRLFSAADEVDVEAAMRHLIAARVDHEIRSILEFARDVDSGARRGLAKAAGFADVGGVSAPESIQRILGAVQFQRGGKESLFSSLAEIVPSDRQGAEFLFKRAAEEMRLGNPGEMFEIQAAARIKRGGQHGTITQLAADRVGPPHHKVDMYTTSHAFSMKSKASPTSTLEFGDGADVTTADLDGLVAQAGGRTAVLVHSNPVSPEVVAACADRHIDLLLVELVR